MSVAVDVRVHLEAAARKVAELERECDQLRADVKRLGKENDEACDTIFELREMLERAHA